MFYFLFLSYKSVCLCPFLNILLRLFPPKEKRNPIYCEVFVWAPLTLLTQSFGFWFNCIVESIQLWQPQRPQEAEQNSGLNKDDKETQQDKEEWDKCGTVYFESISAWFYDTMGLWTGPHMWWCVPYGCLWHTDGSCDYCGTKHSTHLL